MCHTRYGPSVTVGPTGAAGRMPGDGRHSSRVSRSQAAVTHNGDSQGEQHQQDL